MHPDLLNNSLFLRYYNQWQQDPTSILFAPIAEFLIRYNRVDDAIRVCMEGLNHHPDFVSGRLVLAKGLIQKKEYARAKQELKKILDQIPAQPKALELMNATETRPVADTAATSKEPASWETITMGKIYQSQGLLDRAREVFLSILARDPHNNEAKTRLAQLESEA